MPAATYTTCGDDAGTGVWIEWNDGSTTGTVTSTSSTVWAEWCFFANSNATATSSTWVQWTTASNNTYAGRPVYKMKPLPELTAEEKAAAAKREEDRLAAVDLAKKKAEEADKRAEELLVAHLDEEQKKEYRHDRSFHVRARNGERYHVRRDWAGHVSRVDDKGKGLERFCIHPTVPVPYADNQLLAKLMLETDPESFRRAANVTNLVA